ncbi:Rhodanese-related sulfurtransferase [Maribacter sedimenticola]|uniref:Rhodanese-related sulfurtransferase n=1 Tax=Maribacter sedimenticola TaxID=228956 RepID=A0ABY1SEE2_9FLAO|nr:rhodanese-like domain-containing protein [Maribacter sedimenticola]SNR29296.1 Rhodanese-related sulfurtransferase [Maribacter sedimenticola]
MKKIVFVLLLVIGQVSYGQITSQPIADFTFSNAENVLLLDVRTPQEYKDGHIDGAINIDWFSNDFNEKVKNIDKNKIIYVYCKKGGRSLKSQERLASLGFTKVINLEGGFDDWQNDQR